MAPRRGRRLNAAQKAAISLGLRRSTKRRRRNANATTGRINAGRVAKGAGVVAAVGAAGTGVYLLSRKKGKSSSSTNLLNSSGETPGFPAIPDPWGSIKTGPTKLPRQAGRIVGAGYTAALIGGFEGAAKTSAGVIGEYTPLLTQEAKRGGALALRSAKSGVVRHNAAVSNLNQTLKKRVNASVSQTKQRVGRFVSDGQRRDREARKKLYLRVRKGFFGFSAPVAIIGFSNGRLATFKRQSKLRGRKLSRLHRAKISRTLKARNKGRVSTKDNRAQRILAIREGEVKARSLRNVGYIGNTAVQAVREARITAKFLGFRPRGPKPSAIGQVARVLGGSAVNTGNVARTLTNVSYISKLIR